MPGAIEYTTIYIRTPQILYRNVNCDEPSDEEDNKAMKEQMNNNHSLQIEA